MPLFRSQYSRLLSTYLGPQLKRFVLLSVLVLGGVALQIINPKILGHFIDQVTSSRATNGLVGIAALFVVIAIVQQMATVLATYLGEVVGWTATNALRTDVTMHVLRLDLSFHKAKTPGELIERVDGDVTALANFFSQFIVRVLGSVVLLIGVLVVLWLIDWRVGLALTVFAIVMLAVMIRMRSIAVPHWKAARQASADLYGFIEERLSGTVDIRSSGAQPYVMRRLYELLRYRLRTGSKARVIGTFTWTVPVLGVALSNAIAFGLAAWLFSRGQMTLGTAFQVYYYTQLLFQPLNLLSDQIDDFQKAGAGIVRLQELFNTQTKLIDGRGDPIPDGPLPVCFDNVSFGYEADDLVLQDISFDIEAGKVLGVLGRTGSGKTTLTRLLLRLYDVTKGCLRLSGVDVRDAHLHELRDRIGVVTQDVELFRGTVRDNLVFFNPGVSDDAIVTALHDLGLGRWYTSLPQGLDTVLDAEGGLSAGEAQLLAFTRVFLKSPGLVILDEASSRLDPATEALIEVAVSRLLGNRTGLIIAHRLATVQRADHILILEGGRIVEYGEREALVADPDSRFSSLLQKGVEEVLA